MRPDEEGGSIDSSRIFKILAANCINVDFINILPAQVLFTVQDDDSTAAQRHLSEAGNRMTFVMNCAKVSVVGGGMRDVPGVMAGFVEALVNKEIPLLQTVDSQTTISGLVEGKYMEIAVSALHSQFGLD